MRDRGRAIDRHDEHRGRPSVRRRPGEDTLDHRRVGPISRPSGDRDVRVSEVRDQRAGRASDRGAPVQSDPPASEASASAANSAAAVFASFACSAVANAIANPGAGCAGGRRGARLRRVMHDAATRLTRIDTATALRTARSYSQRACSARRGLLDRSGRTPCASSGDMKLSRSVSCLIVLDRLAGVLRRRAR